MGKIEATAEKGLSMDVRSPLVKNVLPFLNDFLT
jgi:hypothetical protein